MKTKSATLALRVARREKLFAFERAFSVTDVSEIEPTFEALAEKMYFHRLAVEASETF